jgi:hypothetical protein
MGLRVPSLRLENRRQCAMNDRRLLVTSEFAVRPVRGRLTESRGERRTEEQTPELELAER